MIPRVMPELPEVETIRKGLEKYLVGKKIVLIEIKLPRIVTGDIKKVINGKVISVIRSGKGLVINLNNGYSIAAHIKLTGQFIYRSKETEGAKLSIKVGSQLPNRWTHVIFKLDRGGVLYYNDLRQFGWIKIVKTDEVRELPFFKELGPEPPVVEKKRVLSQVFPRENPQGDPFSGVPLPAPPVDYVLTLEKFQEIVSKSPTKIKPLLMDQKKIGGVGNIYANDALWLAEIDPRRSAKSLSLSEQAKLYKAILEVLKRGLKYSGASELNYVNTLGEEGEYQKHFLAYAQNGKPCQKCRTRMQKIFLGGRGTYFCTSCQK